MAQRKPSDEEIRKKAFKASNVIKGYYPERNNDFFNLGFEEGAKWARDYDPWNYVEDGELPEVEQSPESFMRESSELMFIDKLEYSIETGNFVVCDRENKSFFDNGSDVWEPSEVKCFMPIPERQK